MNGKGCPQDPLAVRIVRDDARPGVPIETVVQFLQRHGIFKVNNPTTRGQLVEDFSASLALTEIMRPIARSTIVSNVAAAVVTAQTVILSGILETVRVLRVVEYDSPNSPPDNLAISFQGQTGVGAIPALFQSGAMPGSGKIIGDVSSPMTAEFNRMLPLALLPGDVITFKQNVSPAANISCAVRAWVEDYQLPLRPAGL